MLDDCPLPKGACLEYLRGIYPDSFCEEGFCFTLLFLYVTPIPSLRAPLSVAISPKAEKECTFFALYP